MKVNLKYLFYAFVGFVVILVASNYNLFGRGLKDEIIIICIFGCLLSGVPLLIISSNRFEKRGVEIGLHKQAQREEQERREHRERAIRELSDDEDLKVLHRNAKIVEKGAKMEEQRANDLRQKLENEKRERKQKGVSSGIDDF